MKPIIKKSLVERLRPTICGVNLPLPAVFAKILWEDGIGIMEPTVSWSCNDVGNPNKIQTRSTSFEFYPYIEFNGRPLPYAIADQLKIGFSGGASKDNNFIQMCISSVPRDVWYVEDNELRISDFYTKIYLNFIAFQKHCKKLGVLYKA